jgi:coenzyme F420-reducing hydrogenase delta subunit
MKRKISRVSKSIKKKKPPTKWIKKSTNLKGVTKRTSVKKNRTYIELIETARDERFNEMMEMIVEGLIKWSHYKIIDGVGYHFYRKLK